MRVFTKFIADNGTEFRDRDECLEYEANLAIGDLKDQIKVCGSNKTRLNLATCDWNSIYYLWFKGGDKTAKQFATLWEDRSSGDCPVTEHYHPRGLHAYDESTDTWYFVPERLEEIQDLISDIKKAVDEE